MRPPAQPAAPPPSAPSTSSQAVRPFPDIRPRFPGDLIGDLLGDLPGNLPGRFPGGSPGSFRAGLSATLATGLATGLAAALLAALPARSQPTPAAAAPAAAPAQAQAPAPAATLAQAPARLIDRNRLDVQPRLPSNDAPPTAQQPVTQNQSGAPAPFTLRSVEVTGATLVPPDRLSGAWSSRIGRQVALPDLVAISDAIGAQYREAGYPLHTVLLPAQDFAGGTVRIRVVEGQIADVRIEGEDLEGRDLSLLRAYVDRILAERPLRQSTLERYLLLMNDIPGFTVGSAFEPVENAPAGSTRLRLGVARKRVEFGSGANNLGAVPLGRVQFDINAAIHSLLRQGDRTQLIWGFPGDFRRYQYFGANHTTPIGTDGDTLRISAGYLETHRSNTTLDGQANTFGLLYTTPVIRAVRETLTLSAGFDVLNSNSAFLGFTASDERTRVVRGALTWANQDDWEGVNALSVILSGGLDVFGARQRSRLGGNQSFFKAGIRGGRDQTLPWGFALRLSTSIQLAGETLPPSEKFLYGGPDFGRAFGAATLNGDRGVAAGLELAWKIPDRFTFDVLDGSELYGFLDGARVWNEETSLLPHTDRAATAGIGIRARILQKVQFQVEGARAVVRPNFSLTGREDWRVVFSLRSIL